MIGLSYIWQNARETEIRTTCHVIKIRCVDIQRQRQLAKMREKRSLSLYGESKHRWGKRGVHILLHYKRKKQYSMVQARNLEIKRCVCVCVCVCGGGLKPPMHRGGEQRGGPEQQMAIYQPGYSTQNKTHCQKCH
jgi:hypothetical protein